MNRRSLLVLLSTALIAGEALGQAQPSVSLVRRCDQIRTLLSQYRHAAEASLLADADRQIAGRNRWK